KKYSLRWGDREESANRNFALLFACATVFLTDGQRKLLTEPLVPPYDDSRNAESSLFPVSPGGFTVCRSLLVVTTTLAVCVPAFRAAPDDDPTIRNYKSSQLLALLKKGKPPRQRNAALNLLGILGPKTRRIVAGVITAMKEDNDAEVRGSAAQILGKWG